MRRFRLLSASIFIALGFIRLTLESDAQTHTKGRQVAPFNSSLKPGDSIIISAPDRRIYVYRNGMEIGRAPVSGLENVRLAGTYVYSADSTIDPNGRRDWIYTASVILLNFPSPSL